MRSVSDGTRMSTSNDDNNNDNNNNDNTIIIYRIGIRPVVSRFRLLVGRRTLI